MTEGKNNSADAGSLGKGLTLLTLLQAAHQPLPLSELAEMAGLSPSTTHRLAKSLCDLGFVYQNASGRYCAAPRSLFPLALEHPFNVLRRDCLHSLESLRDRYGPSAKLVIFMGGMRVIVEVALGRYSITPYFGTHDLAPLHVSVSGKILLSGLSAEERDRLLGAAPYEQLTPKSIVEREVLYRHLDEVHRTGFANNQGENITGVSAVGCRLTSAAGATLGVILLTGPSEFFDDERMQAMLSDIRITTDLLSKTSQAVRSLSYFLGV